ncbi:hypothetical protein RB620_13775 [Paenibacillus sp. LHD-117]|uniref:hypothetical protein n=1 Tax=Paenibacillus sp. LHD-117 TaxID=3071412 RepID=UPI0027E18E81|nr:hypothetical protein [Paenibacillus sp. LHD-117]MDQ6420506.1 hypothetical protein [Paenibacillus sp. LHD-117]
MIPELVGFHYFQYNDQLGRFDGENYQIGIVDVCHRPYDPFVQEIIRTHRTVYPVASGHCSPFPYMP